MRSVILMLSIILLIGAWTSSAEKTNKIVVKVKPGVSVEELSEAHPFVKLERPSTLPRVFLFSVENIDDVDHETNAFITDPRVAWAQIDEITEVETDFIPTDPSYQSGDQWFHSRINTSYAWAKGYSGQGQIVQVIDTPVFPDDIDLRNQIDFERSFEGNVIPPAARPVVRPHGTVCTNLIVAEANDFCGVGVAFSARAAIFPFVANDVRLFTEIEVAEAMALGFHVSSNSYGATQCWQSWGCNVEMRGIAPVVLEALELAQNRNNTVFVFTAGNEGRWQGSPNFRAFGSSPRLITVGATRFNGTRAAYSNVGAANWIVAPAGDQGGPVTWSSAISSEGQECREVGLGTSFAAPMVAGAAAILRSAYPQLSWRDVKYILAYSSDRVDPDHPSWFQNAVGRWFSNHYGFGQLNVGNAVELGATWKPVGPLQIRTYHSTFAVPIPLDANATVVTPQISVPMGVISGVESVQLTLDMNISRRGDFQIELISPSGTPCIVLAFRQDFHRNYRNYITSANCFLDEDPAGLWTVRASRHSFSVPHFDFFNSFAVTVWGQAIPSQVELVSSPMATRLSNFKITEGDTFQHLKLFHNFPATIGLFWKDTFGLYGDLFTTQGEPTTGTQRLNPSNSKHPTISVFYGGDHALTYIERVDGALVMKAEVRNIGFIPLTPLTELPFSDINPEHMSVVAVEDHLVIGYRSWTNSFTKLALLDVDFGSRDVTPLCIPSPNVTSDDVGSDAASDGDCTEIVYRRDGKISVAKQIEIRTQSPVRLQSIGMNLVLGTWIEGRNVNGALIRADLSVNITRMQAPLTSIIRAAATAEDVFIAFGHPYGALVERYDKNLLLQDSFTIPTRDAVVALDIAYSHIDGLSLAIVTTKNVSITTFMRGFDKKFLQTNTATISTLLSLTFPVLDVDQAVMPNGDLAVTFSTVQEIHVQVFKSSIFNAPLAPHEAPVDPPTSTNTPVVVTVPVANAPRSEEKPPKPVQPAVNAPTDEIITEPASNFPGWAAGLIVIGAIMVVIFVVVFYIERKKRRHDRAMLLPSSDPDLVAYTKMNV